MNKIVRLLFILILVCLVFAGHILAEEKGKERVVFEENTSFEEAKRRAELLSAMKAQNSQKEDTPQNTQLAIGGKTQEKQSQNDSLGQNIMGLLEKMIGKDAAGLLSGYKSGTTKDQESLLDEHLEGDKSKDGVFREFPDEPYKWRGLRKEQVGSGQ